MFVLIKTVCMWGSVYVCVQSCGGYGCIYVCSLGGVCVYGVCVCSVCDMCVCLCVSACVRDVCVVCLCVSVCLCLCVCVCVHMYVVSSRCVCVCACVCVMCVCVMCVWGGWRLLGLRDKKVWLVVFSNLLGLRVRQSREPQLPSTNPVSYQIITYEITVFPIFNIHDFPDRDQ